MKSLADEWQAFERGVMPLTAGATQRREMRRAFYAGAQVLLHLCLSQFEEGTEPTEADLQMMDHLNAELEGFTADVIAGKA